MTTSPTAALDTSLTHSQRFAAMAHGWDVLAVTDQSSVSASVLAIGHEQAGQMAKLELEDTGYTGIQIVKLDRQPQHRKQHNGPLVTSGVERLPLEAVTDALRMPQESASGPERVTVAEPARASRYRWQDAPPWVKWWATDANGRQFWFIMEPECRGACWITPGNHYRQANDKLCEPEPLWRCSLEARPAAGDGRDHGR